MKYLGGYSILDLTDANVSAQANVCYNQDKPVLVYGANGERYFADTIEKVGTSIIITKGGKTITIANDNTITSVGDIQNHLYILTIVSGDCIISFITSEKRDNHTINDMSNLKTTDIDFLKSLKDIIKYELGALYGATGSSTPFETNMSGGYENTLYIYINTFEFEINLNNPENQSDSESLEFYFKQLI